MTEELAVEQVSAPALTFEKFGFDKAIMKSIKNEGYTIPTPIQDLAILPVMGGFDLMGLAQTGSGKTAAFCLPTINKLIHNHVKPNPYKPKALIIAPTRELVMQIGKFIDQFSRGTPIKSLVVAGGQPYQPQIRKLKYGIDILISTPGRLIDHMGSGNVRLEECDTFILDEADRMLDMGFIDEVKEIQSNLNTGHQTVMFSATMNDKVRRLSMQLLKDPEFVEQERKTMVAETITHKLMHVRRKDKTELLIKLLEDETIDKALIFARTKIGADKLCDELKYAFQDTPMRIDAIHGDKKQRTREKILMNYRKGRTKVLVATDVAARGIDVEGITHVINYELPIEAENYIHRVGRTGRAGQSGLAISFCDPSDFRLLREIERLLKIKVDVDTDHDYHFEASEMRDSKGRGKGGGRGRGKFDKPRGRKNDRGGDRNSHGPRRDDRGGPSRDSNDRPRRDRDDRPRSNDNEDRRPRRDSDDYRPRSDRDDRPRDDRPRRDSDDYRPRRDRDDRPRRDSEDRRPLRDSDDRPRKDRDDRPHYSERKHTKHRDGHLGTDKPGDRRPERKQKQEGQRYNPSKFDPLDSSFGFDNDPVLEKLRGKGEKRKTRVEPRDDDSGKKKKTTKRDHYDDNKKPASKKPSNNEAGKSGTLSRKPSSGRPAAKKPGKPSRADRKKVKQTGGHKSFSPKR